MKIVLLSVWVLSLAVLCGCSTSVKRNHLPPTAGLTKNEMFHLTVVRPRSRIGWAVPLIVQLDGRTIAHVRNGARIELDLPPGEYVLSSRPGNIGIGLVAATRRISGKAGETKCFAYTMIFRAQSSSYYVGGWQIDNGTTLIADKGQWEERDPRDPDHSPVAAGHQPSN